MMPAQLSSLVPDWVNASFPCIICGKMTPPDKYGYLSPSEGSCCCKDKLCKTVHLVEILLDQCTDVHHRVGDTYFFHWFSSCSSWISDDSGWVSCLLTPGASASCCLSDVLPFIESRYRFYSPRDLSWSLCDNDTRLYVSGKHGSVVDLYSYLEVFLDFSIKLSDRYSRLSPEAAENACLSQLEK